MINNYDEIFDEIAEFIKSKAKEYGLSLDEMLTKFKEKFIDFKEFLSFARNCEEKTLDVFTFKDCLAWIKPKISPEIHSGAVVYRTAKNNEGNKLMIKVSFLDKNGNPLSDTTSKFLIVHCNSIDSELKTAFGEKDMIILR